MTCSGVWVSVPREEVRLESFTEDERDFGAEFDVVCEVSPLPPLIYLVRTLIFVVTVIPYIAG